jgi:hypothetical protein
MSEVELYGNNLFPTAVAEKEIKRPQIFESKLYYVFVFSATAENYIPVSVFNSRDEAIPWFEEYKRQNEKTNGAILELSWKEFMEMAVDSRLKEIAGVLNDILINHGLK